MSKKISCIIVDDEPVAREVIEAHLSKINSVKIIGTCGSAGEAFSLINEHKVDLIFLDIRRKDLIISGGENINPIEVEEALINIKGITDAAVIGIEDEEWGQKVTAFIVQKKDIIETDMIYNKLKKYLSSYKIPKNIIEVPSIPRNELGKIEYNKLVEFQL